MAGQVQTYLTFTGRAEEALNFYAGVFGSKIESIMRWGDMPTAEGDAPMPDNVKNLVMNSQVLILGGHPVMIADMPDAGLDEAFEPVVVGNNVTIVLSPASRAEADQLFASLSAGGKVRMPMAEMFWGDYYGEVTDKFGVRWMIDTPAKA